MEDITFKRIYQLTECLTSLGEICHRAHFGGYSLSIDNTMFGIVTEGELYLRVCEESANYSVTKRAPLLMFNKRGRMVSLNYYYVSHSVWCDRPLLLRLSELSLNAARRDKVERNACLRLRDLPNLTSQLEASLLAAGVMNEQMLRLLGAEACWLKLKKINHRLSVKVLFALEGAIIGTHEAALPAIRRQELIEWVDALKEEGAIPH